MIVTKTYNTICKPDKKNMKLKKIQPAMYDIIQPLSGSIHRDNGKMGILNGCIQLKFYRRLTLTATDLSSVYREVEIHDTEKLGKKELPFISFIPLLGLVGAPPTRGEDS